MKSPEIDESGEGTTHDPRSLRTKTAYGTTWAPKADWLNLTKFRYKSYVFYCRKWPGAHWDPNENASRTIIRDKTQQKSKGQNEKHEKSE